MIDFHSHILPYMDDGAESIEVSLAMLEESARQGVDMVLPVPTSMPTKMILHLFWHAVIIHIICSKRLWRKEAGIILKFSLALKYYTFPG